MNPPNLVHHVYFCVLSEKNTHALSSSILGRNSVSVHPAQKFSRNYRQTRRRRRPHQKNKETNKRKIKQQKTTTKQTKTKQKPNKTNVRDGRHYIKMCR